MNTMKQFSEDKDTRRNNNHHLSNMSTQLKKGKNDWVHTKDHVEELSKELGVHYTLIARRYNGMYNVHIASMDEVCKELKEWAIAYQLNLKDAKTLTKFINENNIIWT